MPRAIAETEVYLVLDKPAGLICHRDGRTEEPSVAEWLAANYPETSLVGEPWVSPQGESILVSGLVHRLDRCTSGVLLAARTNAMWTHLRAELKARRVEKEYRAIVYGILPLEQGTIVAEIVRSGEKPKRWYAKPCDEAQVRAAITEWRVVGRGSSPEGEPYSMLALFPKTGRTHQLRVHLSSIGHPIVADHLYASTHRPILGFERPALHAFSIAWVLPDSRRVHYEAPLPEDFLRALQ